MAQIYSRVVERTRSNGAPIRFAQNVIKDDRNELAVVLVYGARLDRGRDETGSLDVGPELAQQTGLRVGTYLKSVPIRCIGPTTSRVSYSTVSWWQFAINRQVAIKESKQEFEEWFGNPEHVSKDPYVMLDIQSGLALHLRNGQGFGAGSQRNLELLLSKPGVVSIPCVNRHSANRENTLVDFNQGVDTLIQICSRDRVRVDFAYV